MVSRGLTAGSLQVLPEGLVVPPPAYLVGLAVGLAVIGTILYSRRPAITRQIVVAFTPWMVTGAAAHVLYQLGSAPDVLRPLLSAPTVYATTFLLASTIWALALGTGTDNSSVAVALGGVLTAGLASGAVVLDGLQRGTLSPGLPVVGLVLSVVITGVVYTALDRLKPTLTAATGTLGVLVVFAHTLDGISTAIGVDLLGSGERSPLPRAIMDIASALPTADLLGTGWLFVLVKLGVAVGVLALFADFIEEDPLYGNAALGVVTAVGLGPGAHNLLLFAALGAL